MEQFPSSPHFYIFPLGECCVRANVRILSAFLGTRDALCYKKTFKKDSTFSARHAALSNSWQGLANTPARTHSSAINLVVPTHEHLIKRDMEVQIYSTRLCTAPTQSELTYRYHHGLAEVEKHAIFAYGMSQDKRFYQGLPNQSELVPASGRLLLQNLQLLPIIMHACTCAKVII